MNEATTTALQTWTTDREGSEIREESIVWVTGADGEQAQGFVVACRIYEVQVYFPSGQNGWFDVSTVVLA